MPLRGRKQFGCRSGLMPRSGAVLESALVARNELAWVSEGQFGQPFHSGLDQLHIMAGIAETQNDRRVQTTLPVPVAMRVPAGIKIQRRMTDVCKQRFLC